MFEGADVTEFQRRAEARRKNTTFKKIHLHAKEHQSLHTGVDGDRLSRVVFEISHPSGAVYKVDKSQVKILKLKAQ